MIEINNGQPIPLMWYIFILLFFRILALENVAKILTTGPMLGVRIARRLRAKFWPDCAIPDTNMKFGTVVNHD